MSAPAQSKSPTTNKSVLSSTVRDQLYPYFEVRKKVAQYYFGFEYIKSRRWIFWLLIIITIIGVLLSVVFAWAGGNWLLLVLAILLSLAAVFLASPIAETLGLFQTEQPAIEKCKEYLRPHASNLKKISKMAEADLSNLRISATIAVSFYVPLIAVLLRPELKPEDSLYYVVIAVASLGFLSHLLMVMQSNADTVIRLAIIDMEDAFQQLNSSLKVTDTSDPSIADTSMIPSPVAQEDDPKAGA